MDTRIGVLACAVAMAAGGAQAHGGHGGGHPEGVLKAAGAEAKLFGRPGDPKSVSRIVNVEMGDAGCRTPGELSLRQGNTVRFEIKNFGKEEQEFVIGSLDDLTAHAESAQKDEDIPHDEPHMAHVHSSETAQVVWHFTRVGIFYYGCLAPGFTAPVAKHRIVILR